MKMKCVQEALHINRNNKKEHYAKDREKVVKIPGLSRYYTLLYIMQKRGTKERMTTVERMENVC